MEKPTWTLPVAWHCAAQLASPAHPHLPCHLPPLARRTKGAWSPRASTRRPPPASLLAAGGIRGRHAPPDPPCPLPSPLVAPLLLCSLPRCCPSATIATDAVRRAHRSPLAPPSCPKALPPRPLPLRQAVHRRMPCGAITVAFFTSGRRGSPSPLAAVSASPELAVVSSGPL